MMLMLQDFPWVLYVLLLLMEGNNAIDANNKEVQKATKLPPCAACTLLTDSFKKGIVRTSRGKFEGGDTAWEETKMGSYNNSEVRFIEIQEGVCSEIERGQKQCETNNEDYEDLLEEWWHKWQDEQPDLHQWLCTNKLKMCCPVNHYGANCLPCTGGIQNPCSGNGKCKGAGTRKGSGTCACSPGYDGDVCDQCNYGYYEAYKDNTKILCEKCSKACNGPCNGAGNKACLACNDGWVMDTERGCYDVNECLASKPPCEINQFCVNNDGTYTCLHCDKACKGCTGDGPDMCLVCADNYREENGMCLDNTAQEREKQLTFSRYITYGGLAIATCIIFQKHTVLAAIIGFGVASYITFSEYYLTTLDNDPSNNPELPIGMKTQNEV